jgi:hypothetical protein
MAAIARTIIILLNYLVVYHAYGAFEGSVGSKKKIFFSRQKSRRCAPGGGALALVAPSLGCDFVRPVRFTKDGRLPSHRLRTFFFFGAKLVFAQKLVLLHRYTNIHYKMTIFYLCIGFVEVKNTDTHFLYSSDK